MKKQISSIAFIAAARPATNSLAAIVLSLLALGSARAAVVYNNLNTNPSTTNIVHGFTQFAQRFTTVSEGTGLHLDLNIVTLLNGPQSYAVELWSANGAGTNLNELLATIGSGTVSTTDRTALTSFDLTYGLAASTNYFVKLTTATHDAGWVLGPSSSTTLNSVFRYGVGSLNSTDPSLAGGMKVDVVAVPEPSTSVMGLAGLACGGYSLVRRRKRA